MRLAEQRGALKVARVAVFSKYFGYDVGGAERSVRELMATIERAGNDIVAVVPANVSGFGAQERKLVLPSTWEVREVNLRCSFTRFRFLDYFVNKPTLQKIAELIADTDALYAYGTLAPAVINAYRGKTYYLVRDEYGLGWNINYYKGVRRVVQEIYHASEWPLRVLWGRDLRKAMARSCLIANSKYIARELRKIAPQAPIKIVYPQIDKEALRSDYERAVAQYQGPRGVVVVGDNILKGGDIVRRVAEIMRDVPFFVFDRRYSMQLQKGNIMYMPWQSPGAVYARARVVMIPSRWAEAFPRVAIEAKVLGIPVLGSYRGGIPEAILDTSCLVKNIEDAEEWAVRLRKILASHY